MPSLHRNRRIINYVDPFLFFLYEGGNDPRMQGGTYAGASTKTYIDRDGTVRTAASGEPRFQHYVPGQEALGPSLLLEGSRTNDLTYGRVLSNGAWTATGVTVDPVAGADGVLASASRLTATAPNGTVIRTAALVHASAARAGSPMIRRITGTGNVDITLDGGATWTTVVPTSAYTVLWKTQTLANSQFGIRLATSGDVVDVDYTQNEAGAFPSSRIPTVASAVTRAADALSFAFPYAPQAMTVYADQAAVSPSTAANNTIFTIGDVALADRFAIARFDSSSAGRVRGGQRNGTTTVLSDAASTAVFGDRVETLFTIAADGSVTTTTSKNAGTAVVGATSAANALSAAWAATTLALTNEAPFAALRSLKIAAGVQSMDKVRRARLSRAA